MTKQSFSHPFTLIELMVAAAVLVIMMSFIFQFTNSAQRLWTTNTGRTEMSESMDVIFNLLNEDFENMYIISPEQDLDAQAGWYCMHTKEDSGDYPFANYKGYNLEDLCFFTQSRSGDQNPDISVIHPVRYHFVPGTDSENPDIGTGKLYRFEAKSMTWDKIGHGFKWKVKADGTYDLNADTNEKQPGNGYDPDWYFEFEKYTATDEIPDGYNVGDVKWPLYDEENLVAENLKSVQIFSSAAVNVKTGDRITKADMPLMEIPQGITVTVIASVPSTLRNGENSNGDVKTTDRAMTRVYMLR